MRQLGLHTFADLHNGEVAGGLQHGAGDEFALAVGEFAVDVGARGFTHNFGDDLLGVLRGNAADVGRGHVALLVFGVLAGFRVLFAHALQFVHVNLARVAVDGHARVPVQTQHLLVTLRQALFQAVQEHQFVDVLFRRQFSQRLHEFS